MLLLIGGLEVQDFNSVERRELLHLTISTVLSVILPRWDVKVQPSSLITTVCLTHRELLQCNVKQPRAHVCQR